MATCPYFTTHLLEMEQEVPMIRSYVDLDSFVIYICMGGQCTVRDDKGNVETIRQGESMLIPARTCSVTLVPAESTKILETFVTQS